MIILACGIALWSLLHFVPSAARPLRQAAIDRLGDGTYRLLFSGGIVLSIALIIIGWRSGVATTLYEPPSWGGPVGSVFILIGFLFFGLAKAETNVKRFVRHPQLTGLVAWALGHLLANGDSLSVLAFGGLGVWAIAEMLLINRREGPWHRPGPVPLRSEIKPLVIGTVIFTVFFFAHSFLFGVSPIST